MLKKIFVIFASFFLIIFPKQIRADMSVPGIYFSYCEGEKKIFCTYMFKSNENEFENGDPTKIYTGENTCSKYETNNNYSVSGAETYSYERYYYTNWSEEQISSNDNYTYPILKVIKDERGGSTVKTINATFDDSHDYPIIYSVKSFCTNLTDSTLSTNCNSNEKAITCNYDLKQIKTDKYNMGIQITKNTCSGYEDNPKYRYLDGFGGEYYGGKVFCSKNDGTEYTFNEMHKINTNNSNKETSSNKQSLSITKIDNSQKESIKPIGIIIIIITVFSLNIIFYLKRKNKLSKKGPTK